MAPDEHQDVAISVAISVIVSTIGRPGPLRELIDSLSQSRGAPPFELIVVDQSDEGSCTALLAELDLPFPARALTSARGASLGRNVGSRVAHGAILTFPDDNAFYQPDTLARAFSLMQDGWDAVSGIQVTRDGRPSMLRWLPAATAITVGNVQRSAIESTIFIKRSEFESLQGFDERIGVGSAGPFQAGEVTDLLLRLLYTGARLQYDPSIVVVSDDPRDNRVPNFDRKMRGYGTGMGHLYRKHPLPVSQLALYCSRKLVAVPVRLVRGRGDLARADLAWVAGAVAGYRSREAL
jgi:glycosyltransferase involved in cell wall biosynthesis